MATAKHISTAALDDTFKGEIFSKEVEGWLGRATPAHRERFERLFESIRSISEAKKTPDAHNDFVHTTLDKIRQGSSRTTSGPNARTPALARGSPAVVSNGWSYAATRVAFDRPETRNALLSIQEQVAAQQERKRQQQQAEVDTQYDRPQSAPGGPGGGGIHGCDRELTTLQQSTDRRRVQSFGHGTPGGPAAGAIDRPRTAAPPLQTSPSRKPHDSSGSVPSMGSGFVPLNPHFTRYQETFNLHSVYPDIYDQALRDTRVEQPPNTTFYSEWGNSLKLGAEEAQKLYMRTTYNTLNDEVVRFKTDAEAVREREFFKWMQKQMTFYGDLLSKDKIADLEAVLANATEEQKHEILQALRTTHAVADDCFDRTRSHSQAVHGAMRRVEDAATEEMWREYNKARNVGRPVATALRRGGGGGGGGGGSARRPATAELKPATVNLTLGGGGSEGGGGGGGGKSSSSSVSVAGSRGSSAKALKPTRRPATASASLGGGGGGGGSGTAVTAATAASGSSRGVVRPVSVPPPRRADGEKCDLFKSKVPLTWPSGSTDPTMSSYESQYGKHGVGRVRPNSALFRVRPAKYTDATCPYGAINPVTAAGPLRTAYPVPESFTTGGAVAFPLPSGNTTYRNEYAPRDPVDVALQLRAAAALAETSRKVLDRVSIPLGARTGVNILPSEMWVSETHESYVPHALDVRERVQAAQAIRAMHMAPTGASGKMTLGVAQATLTATAATDGVAVRHT